MRISDWSSDVCSSDLAHMRYREALGKDIGPIPEGLYPGDYLKSVGQKLAATYGDRYAAAPEAEWLVLFRKEAVAAMMDMIRADLALLGIRHDVFSSEAELQAAGKPETAEAELRARGLVYDGVLEAPKGETPEDWEPVELPLFRSTQFGDDQDRPIKKSNGSRSEEHTSELQSLMRISYAVFCLKKKQQYTPYQ